MGSLLANLDLRVIEKQLFGAVSSIKKVFQQAIGKKFSKRLRFDLDDNRFQKTNQASSLLTNLDLRFMEKQLFGTGVSSIKKALPQETKMQK